MDYETKINIGRFIMAVLIGLVGATLIYFHGNGWIVLGIVLMIWSNNIERATFK